MNIFEAAKSGSIEDFAQFDPTLINKVSEYGDTPLLLASRYNTPEVVKFLINNGAKVNFKNERTGFSALIYAADNGRLEVVKFLLNKQASFKDETSNGETALMLAAINGHTKVVKYLIENTNSNINHQNKRHDSILICASIGGQTEVVEILGKHGANIDYKNNEGKRAIDLANEKKFFKVVEILEIEETAQKLAFCPSSVFFKRWRKKIEFEETSEDLKSIKLAIVDTLKELNTRRYFNDPGEIYRLYWGFKNDPLKFKEIEDSFKENSLSTRASSLQIDNFKTRASVLIKNYFKQIYPDRKPLPKGSCLERSDVSLKHHHLPHDRNRFCAGKKYWNLATTKNSLFRSADGI